MKKQTIENLRTAYENLESPAALDHAIQLGMERGRKTMNQNHKKTTKILQICASVILAGSILTGAINVSPAFADVLEKVPLIGQVVKVLRFTDNEAEGGQINDGVNLDEVTIVPEAKGTSLKIHFNKSGDLTLASAYKLSRYDDSILNFQVSGVRYMDMVEDFEAIKAIEGVQDIYTIMTMDDSMVRFNIILEPNYTFEVKEHESPAMLEVIITESETTSLEQVYAVRSQSFENGEAFAIMEEAFIQSGIDYYILKDDQNMMVYEFGRFETEAAAEEYLASLSLGDNLLIEQLDKGQIPSNR